MLRGKCGHTSVSSTRCAIPAPWGCRDSLKTLYFFLQKQLLVGRANITTFTPTGNESSALSTQSTGGEAGALRTLLPGPPTCRTLRSGRKKKSCWYSLVTASRHTVTKAALSISSKTPHGVVIQTGPWAHTAKPLTLQRLPRGGSSTTSPHPNLLQIHFPHYTDCPALTETWMRFLFLRAEGRML